MVGLAEALIVLSVVVAAFGKSLVEARRGKKDDDKLTFSLAMTQAISCVANSP